MIIQSKYGELLRGRFKVLGDFTDQAIAKKTIFESLKITAEYIVPLMTQTDDFKPLYLDLSLNKKDVSENYYSLLKESHDQVTRKLTSLKSTLEQENLSQHPSIKGIVESATINVAMHAFRDREEQVYSLCHYLLRLGREDLLKGYATTRSINKYLFFSHKEGNVLPAYSCCDCGYVYDDLSALKDVDGRFLPFDKLGTEWICPICRCQTDFQVYEYSISSNVTIIDEFIFAPSIIKFDRLEKSFLWDNVQDASVALDFLLLVMRCWNTPFSFFDDKNLNYTNLKARFQSLQYLNLHSFWAIVNAIKTQKNNHEKVYFFIKESLTRCLELIMNAVILYQETIIGNMTKDASQPIPYFIEIRLDGLYLLLDVRWTKDGSRETYIIHKFVNQSGPYEFMKQIDAAENGSSIIIDEKKIGASGLTVNKFLERIHFFDIFAKIFFKERITNCVTLRSKEILLADIEGVSLVELCRCIRSLEKFVSNF